MTETRTYTSAFARIELIKIQFQIAWQRTTSITQERIEQLLQGIDDDKRWIRKLSIFGLTEDNLCRAQLTLEIDWNEYDLQLSQGRVTVAFDEEKWLDNAAIELNAAIKGFNRFVEKYKLKTTWQINYNKQCCQTKDQELAIDRALGLVDAEPISWVGKAEELNTSIEELPEIIVGCSFCSQ